MVRVACWAWTGGVCVYLKRSIIFRNLIEDATQLEYLAPCQALRILSLASNPVVASLASNNSISAYRKHISNLLPDVSILDGIPLRDEMKHHVPSPPVTSRQTSFRKNVRQNSITSSNNEDAPASKHVATPPPGPRPMTTGRLKSPIHMSKPLPSIAPVSFASPPKVETTTTGFSAIVLPPIRRQQRPETTDL